jgi:predicted SnoaL-like aldol condensation-catalyzing enzyme
MWPGPLKRFPDLHVQIEDMIAEDDKVVVRNHWTATDSQNGKKLEFRGIVIWRIANRKIVERWAYLENPARGLIDATKLVTNSRQSVLRAAHPERAA